MKRWVAIASVLLERFAVPNLLPTELGRLVRPEHEHLQRQFSQMRGDRDVPKFLYIAQTTNEPPRSPKILEMYERERNAGWKVNLIDDAEKTKFMKDNYQNTSTLWAYMKINPTIGVVRADLWRFSQLYLTGGVYSDIDTLIGTSLDTIIRNENATLLLTTMEKSAKVEECFVNSHHLSVASLKSRFGQAYDQLFSGPTRTLTHNFVSIAPIFVVPGHPAILALLQNAVEIIYKEYSRQSVLHPFSYGEHDIGYIYRWKQVLCTSGPSMALPALCEHLLDEQKKRSTDKLPPHYLTFVEDEFKKYKGVPKVVGYINPGPNHYTHQMRNISNRLLQSYAPLSHSSLQDACLANMKKTAFWIFHSGARHPVRDWDQFQALKIHKSHCVALHPADMIMLPIGSVLDDSYNFSAPRNRALFVARTSNSAQ